MTKAAPIKQKVKRRPAVQVAQVGDVNLAPTTTAAQDMTKAGQRHINLMWESTQRTIALIVVVMAVGVAAFKAVFDALRAKDTAVAGPAFIFLVAAANLVVGFYFGRTNHNREGGVGVAAEVGR